MVGTQSASLKGDLGELMNDVVSYELYCPAADQHFPQVAGLLAKYQPLAKAAGVDPLGFYSCPFAYTTMQILQQAVEGVGSTDSEKLAKFMHKANFKTIVGDVQFGEDGEWARPQMLTVQFRGIKGKGYEQFADPRAEVILHPAEFKTGDLHYPMGG
jgi:branched-chain amino acid transport system substrate-binding protein